MKLKYKLPILTATMTFLTGISSTVGTPNPEQNKDCLARIEKIITIPTEILSQNFKFDTPYSAIARNYDVVYTTANGQEIIRKGGTRAWRNNNPGCIRTSQFTRDNGAIGNAGGFAVFPDEQTGMIAIEKLLMTDAYKNQTIARAMYSYAPPFENNTAAYNRYLRKLTGLPIETRIADLNQDQLKKLALAIKQVEGWRVGTEIQDTINKKIVQLNTRTI